MADINHVCVSGNLTRDAETRSTGSGLAVTSFTVASNERRKSISGDWEDYPNYFDCTMFGAYGASLQPYLTKGTKVFVGGSLRYSTWERDGQKRSKVEIIATDLVTPPKSKPMQQQQYEDIPF